MTKKEFYDFIAKISETSYANGWYTAKGEKATATACDVELETLDHKLRAELDKLFTQD